MSINSIRDDIYKGRLHTAVWQVENESVDRWNHLWLPGW